MAQREASEVHGKAQFLLFNYRIVQNLFSTVQNVAWLLLFYPVSDYFLNFEKSFIFLLFFFHSRFFKNPNNTNKNKNYSNPGYSFLSLEPIRNKLNVGKRVNM